ncbi:MAG: hypothetical protein LBM38_01645 [Clostridiales bacterium]|jgi:Zn finger protein HypA/HybF involved in hydrogenase expression|nr:hypothetical protein [Clostridiales bacterium]
MTTSLTKILTYKCFECGAFATAEISAFKLNPTGGMLFCSSCGSKTIEIRQIKDNYIFSTVCHDCAESVGVKIPIKDFWRQDELAIKCCECSSVLIKSSNKAPRTKIDTMIFPNYQNQDVTDRTITKLQELVSTKRFSCGCGNNNPNVEINYNNIKLSCPKCGASHSFYTRNLNDLRSTSRFKEIVLEKPTTTTTDDKNSKVINLF